MLPASYTYHHTTSSDPIVRIVRVKEVIDETSAKAWLAEYSKATKTTWRLLRTYPSCGKVNVYKVQYRFQHNTDQRFRQKGRRESKNTDCPAQLHLVVKRSIRKSRAKCPDKNATDFPAIITFRHSHNHSVDSAAFLRHRDLSDETRKRLLDLFRQGHSPSSAIQALQVVPDNCVNTCHWCCRS